MEINLELPSGLQDRLISVDKEANLVDIDNEIIRDVDGADLSIFSNNNNKSGGMNHSYVPHNGTEFETKEAAYSFYREYARFVGFGITIKASRRSKKSGNFIDIKIACSRFGTIRHSTTTTSSRSCPKTDCKASVHLKRRTDGKWFIYSFLEDHNHDICADDFYNSIRGKNKVNLDFECRKKGLQLALGERDVQLLLDYFMCMQAEAPGFYYVLDFAKEGYMRNVFWVDPKSRNDYVHFSDVVFFDTHYVRSEYRIPFVPVIGVDSHFQFILLGCALIGDEKPSTFIWLMKTWLRAVGGVSPKLVITDNDKSLIEATYEVFPDASHCFCPWHVFRDIDSNLSHKLSEFEIFLRKFKKCVNKSQTNIEFENRWRKMVNKFDLTDDKLIQALYEDRTKWVPTYMRGIFLGGFCTVERSQSVASCFDKYLQKETTMKEFIDKYKLFLHEMSEGEARVGIEMKHTQAVLIFHSPFEKQMSKVYTHEVFQKFQTEVSGIHACNVEKKGEDNKTILYRVDDFELKQDFIVAWNQEKDDICCLCRLYEYNGFLCRHALSVLELSGIFSIPSNCILKRWTRVANIRDATPRKSVNMNLRVQRLDDLCKLAVKVGEEGSSSNEAYEVAYHALEAALRHCVAMNTSVKSVIETNKQGGNIVKGSKTKEVPKKRKIRAETEIIPRMQEDVEHLNRRSVSLYDSHISQHYLQGMDISSRIPVTSGDNVGSTPLSSMRDYYYSDQSTSQGDMLQGDFGFRAPSLEGYFHPRDSMNNETSRNMNSEHMPG